MCFYQNWYSALTALRIKSHISNIYKFRFIGFKSWLFYKQRLYIIAKLCLLALNLKWKQNWKTSGKRLISQKEDIPYMYQPVCTFKTSADAATISEHRSWINRGCMIPAIKDLQSCKSVQLALSFGNQKISTWKIVNRNLPERDFGRAWCPCTSWGWQSRRLELFILLMKLSSIFNSLFYGGNKKTKKH